MTVSAEKEEAKALPEIFRQDEQTQVRLTKKLVTDPIKSSMLKFTEVKW